MAHAVQPVACLARVPRRKCAWSVGCRQRSSEMQLRCRLPGTDPQHSPSYLVPSANRQRPLPCRLPSANSPAISQGRQLLSALHGYSAKEPSAAPAYAVCVCVHPAPSGCRCSAAHTRPPYTYRHTCRPPRCSRRPGHAAGLPATGPRSDTALAPLTCPCPACVGGQAGRGCGGHVGVEVEAHADGGSRESTRRPRQNVPTWRPRATAPRTRIRLRTGMCPARAAGRSPTAPCT